MRFQRNKHTFQLIGHDNPLGEYPGPVVPIGELNGKKVAVLLSSSGVKINDIPPEAEFKEHNQKLRNRTNTFDPQKHRLFALSENNVLFYREGEENEFFSELLRGPKFSVDRPLFRYTLAMYTKNPELIIREFTAGFESIFVSGKTDLSWDTDKNFAQKFYEDELSEIIKRIETLDPSFAILLPKNWSEAKTNISANGTLIPSQDKAVKKPKKAEGILYLLAECVSIAQRVPQIAKAALYRLYQGMIYRDQLRFYLTQSVIKEKKTGKFQYHIQPQVFWISTVLILGLVVINIPLQSVFADVFKMLFGGAIEYFGWFLILTVNAVLFYCIYLIFSKYSDVKIGGPDAKPEFSVAAWVAMLFSAGIGIGLLYYGVGEPMYHFVAPPTGTEAGTAEAAKTAMLYTFLHWGFHGWAIYALVGLSLAFANFNRGLPLSVRTVFYPLIGDRIYGWIGHIIDIFGTTCALIGVATALGLGCQHINAGLNYLFGVPINGVVQVIMIAIITAFTCTSVVFVPEGVIKEVSVINMWCTSVLLCFVLVLGPTLFIVKVFFGSVGVYLSSVVSPGFWSEIWSGGKWQNTWTLFFWAWWIAWGPFVGMFIGRISYGRTVREFIGGVLVVPVLISFIWFSIIGGSALWAELFGSGGVARAVQEDFSTAFFVFLQQFPLSNIMCFLAIIVVVILFATTLDSGSVVIDMISAGGHIDTPVPQRIYWSWLEGAVAAALLFSGGMAALQTATTLAGVPFAAVLLLMIWSMQKGLKDYREEKSQRIQKART